MDQDAKKTVLRMIPYGIYVLTADDGKGNVAAATVNWVTQTAFAPPLVVVGVKTDSGAYQIIKDRKTFARASARPCSRRSFRVTSACRRHRVMGCRRSSMTCAVPAARPTSNSPASSFSANARGSRHERGGKQDG